MRKWILRIAYAAAVLAPVGALANYAATVGAGTNFGSIVIGGVHFVSGLICDMTTANQCAAVSAGGAVKVDNSAVTQPVSAASLPLPSGAATAALQGTNTATTAHTCSVAGYSEVGCLGQIDDDVKGAAAAGTNRIGYVSDDPCTQLTKTNVAIATATGTTQVVAPSGSTQVYVCSVSLVAGATAVVNLVGGTGATCTTGTPVAAIGSTTAANGMSLAANGGLTFGNGGATVVRTTTAGHGLCLIQSGTTALAGNITYIQQ